jgi:hypothetical protein
MSSKAKLEQLIREEYKTLFKEAAEKAPEVDKALEKLRKKLLPEMVSYTTLGTEVLGGSRPHKRIHIKSVSEILDIPINELTLHFLNNVKTKNERSLVEYHLGHCYFYKEIN